MVIGIMSDTHEHMDNIKKAITLFNNKKVERVFHCGDIISPITFKEFQHLHCPIDLVFGNNDGEKVFLVEKFKGKGTFHPPGYSFEINKKKFIMMHEPVGIESLARSGSYDYILYGHTHKSDIRKVNSSTIINIGETGGWVTGEPTVGILNIDTGEIEIIKL
ncbi:MAG: metallophosphoesterase [Spirochaetes bacterium]|nr:metallophosphoesterase [Spirochaetota bacterium]